MGAKQFKAIQYFIRSNYYHGKTIFHISFCLLHIPNSIREPLLLALEYKYINLSCLIPYKNTKKKKKNKRKSLKSHYMINQTYENLFFLLFEDRIFLFEIYKNWIKLNSFLFSLAVACQVSYFFISYLCSATF